MKIDEVDQLRSELSRGNDIALVYVAGGDDGVVDAVVEVLSTNAMARGSEVKVVRLDASGAKSDAWEQYAGIASAFPMFDEKTIVVMNGCAGGTRVPADVKTYLESPPPFLASVFSADRKTAASPLAKVVKAHGRVLDFKELKDQQARAMAVAAAREAGVVLDGSAADALIDMVGTDIGAIDSAVRSLSGLVADVGGQVRVGAEDLAGLVRRTRKHAPWDIDEAIERRDIGRAVKVALREIQDARDSRSRAIALYNSVLRRARMILLAIDMVSDRVPATEAMSALNIRFPFMYDRLVDATRKYGRDELEAFLKSALDVEIRMKRGMVSPETQVVELLMSLMVRRSDS